MVTLLLRLLRLLPLLFGAHRHVALENLALRHQLAVYKRTLTRPKVRKSDRLFWVALSRVWADWRRSEEHTSELQSLAYLVCRLLLEKKKKIIIQHRPHYYR